MSQYFFFCKTVFAKAKTHTLCLSQVYSVSLLLLSLYHTFCFCLSFLFLICHSPLAVQNFLCREVEYSRPVSPGGMLEMRRHVRRPVGLFLFSTQTPLRYLVEAHRERAKSSRGSSPQVCVHGMGSDCSQTGLNKEINPQGGLVGERM